MRYREIFTAASLALVLSGQAALAQDRSSCSAALDCRHDTLTATSVTSDTIKAAADPLEPPPPSMFRSRMPLRGDSRREMLIARAAHASSIRIEELQLPDGRRLSKVHGAHGAYCVYKESVGLTKGRDQLTAGVRTMMTSCP